jgi:hypothetical protein
MYKIKVISLKRRQDRREKFSYMFRHIGFDYVDGLDGRTYNITDFDKKFIEGNDYQKYGIHIPSLLAANWTHLNLLEECANQSLPYIVLEDDAKLTRELDLDFNKISQKQLDIFWLMKDEPSILAYMVWPSGAKKIRDYVFNEAKLDKGLDWKLYDLKKLNRLVGEEPEYSYFYQIPGEDSDITTLYNYELR